MFRSKLEEDEKEEEVFEKSKENRTERIKEEVCGKNENDDELIKKNDDDLMNKDRNEARRTK